MKQFEETIKLLENSNFYYIITTNMAGKYSYINNHYAQSFSYISETILEMPYWITMHADDTKVCEEVAAKCFMYPEKCFRQQLESMMGKVVILLPNGSTRQ